MAKGDDDFLADAKEAYRICNEHENANRLEAMDDLRFARLADQWPEKIRRQRELEGRPCLTINRLPTFLRQVVNDARQNKPAVTVHAADDKADPMTAEVFSGLIRNIEYQSDADVAYDTALESAATMGFGYWRVNTRYTYDDSFEQDIVIETVANPFSIYGDPYSTRYDSADWNLSFVVDLLPKAQFEKRYKGADAVNWMDSDGYSSLSTPWIEDNQVRLAEYWTREEVKRKIIALTNGDIIDLKEFETDREWYAHRGVQPLGQTRSVASQKVTQTLMTGAEVLDTIDWAGCYIPIVPVYGDEVNVGGERFFRSLVRDAKDPQRMFNYWRTMATELIALAPKAPFIGPKGAFETDMAKWETANSEAHAFIEYDGPTGPQRQPFAGVPAGVLQEALNAADDLKSVTGIYDASLGARGNETSGKAILMRQREGDTATYHYIDNLSRAIRHCGRILIDLIPKVYSTERVIRVMDLDRNAMPVPINQPVQIAPPGMDPMEHFFDLTVGKYDLTVEAGPSFTTKREEAANQMLELIRAYPQAAMVMGDLLAKNLDWPGADEIAQRLQAMLPAAIQQISGENGQQAPPAIPPEVQKALQDGQKQLQQTQQQLQQTDAQAKSAMADNAKLQAQLNALQADRSIQQDKVEVDQFRATTDRMSAIHEITKPPEVKQK